MLKSAVGRGSGAGERVGVAAAVRRHPARGRVIALSTRAAADPAAFRDLINSVTSSDHFYRGAVRLAAKWSQFNPALLRPVYREPSGAHVLGGSKV